METNAQWIDAKTNPPQSGPIVKRWKNGSVWAGNYTANPKESNFDFWVPLPGYAQEYTQDQTFYINGIQLILKANLSLSYEELILRALGQVPHNHTVTYASKGGNGSMSAGDYIAVTSGMIFNVSNTNSA